MDSKVPDEWGRDTYALHRQEAWKTDAANPKFPLPLRVAFYAYGTHGLNGHAVLRQGELRKVLGKVVEHEDSSEYVMPDRRSVDRAIRQAVDFGLLAEGSRGMCLVVPRGRISGGDVRKGGESKPCPRHEPEKARKAHLRSVG